MIIKKFKNGNINLKLEKSDYFYYGDKNGLNIDKIYDVLTMDDLYFNQINGYMYLVDFNKSLMYDFSDCYINILEYLKSLLVDNKTVKLFPISKKESKSLFIDLENGF